MDLTGAGFSEELIAGVEKFLDAEGPGPAEIAWLTLLWFRLRQAEDDPAWFPKGKWATIQRIEFMIDEILAKKIEVGP